jgi:hypothetical protein
MSDAQRIRLRARSVLQGARCVLHRAGKAEPRGTLAETEKLDLIDGIIVSLVRMAQKAGDAAAKELGEPSIATAFELSVLYKRKAKTKSDAAPSVEGESNG